MSDRPSPTPEARTRLIERLRGSVPNVESWMGRKYSSLLIEAADALEALGGERGEGDLGGEQSSPSVDANRTVHELKCWPGYFEDVLIGAKTFEVRRNDRGFRKGDQLRLRECGGQNIGYTGRETTRLVTYVIPGGEFGIARGYVVMGLASATPADAGSKKDTHE